ncbi:hypothetical protein HRR83_000430 [Exophiala dermatitidis]|uniref:Uncharacterized protein n=1 Tax=Exophiala dermatitidis TaxID=5970 RepID=A0AAN6F3G1_EXODE|nr:hypothetical protein HRR74_000432 [Exophiala dermatitidis]KAJ4528313.1 hypothetical protein HRR73_000936 [Exophiala dermatitidis]KAJ4531261.1 hypothetical protein HRR76_008929 [Exophiala dermatitidis]KAJ4558423.1 hypothetical protein HRR77_000431 [Exophiala dermatitidis]KAJ4590141.1 hypothetical protein HRR82_000518 [Exophiala dermatitidis]
MMVHCLYTAFLQSPLELYQFLSLKGGDDRTGSFSTKVSQVKQVKRGRRKSLVAAVNPHNLSSRTTTVLTTCSNTFLWVATTSLPLSVADVVDQSGLCCRESELPSLCSSRPHWHTFSSLLLFMFSISTKTHRHPESVSCQCRCRCRLSVLCIGRLSVSRLSARGKLHVQAHRSRMVPNTVQNALKGGPGGARSSAFVAQCTREGTASALSPRPSDPSPLPSCLSWPYLASGLRAGKEDIETLGQSFLANLHRSATAAVPPVPRLQSVPTGEVAMFCLEGNSTRCLRVSCSQWC